MIESPRYNPKVDISPVYAGLSINLEEAVRTGIVKDTGVEVEYNGIEDPALIRGRFADTFDALDERNAVVNREIARIKNVSSTDNNEDLPK